MRQLCLILFFNALAVSLFANTLYSDALSVFRHCERSEAIWDSTFQWLDPAGPVNANLRFVLSATLTKTSPAAKFIIPALFITYGALAQAVQPLQQLDGYTNKEVSRHFKHRSADDYLLFAPGAFVYGLDWVGVKAKHNFRDRTFVVITSHLIMTGIVQSGKTLTAIERPDGSGFRSFPSGHTAFAFTGAHILFKEYKDVSPWIGVAGYATATTVGTLRILNRRHWISDVAAGAGVGIFSVEIGYLLLPVFHKIIGVNQTKSNMLVAPVVGINHYGLGVAYVF